MKNSSFMSGWKRMNYQLRLLLFAMFTVPVLTLADEADTSPSMELLEFLGEWETDEGEWISPDELDNDYLVELLDNEETREENE